MPQTKHDGVAAAGVQVSRLFLSNIAATFAWHLSICTIEADTATENHDYHQDTDAGQFFTPSYEARAQHVD
jgi:hypothetical protein